MRDRSYDTALVCLNGHMVNESSEDHPEFNTPYHEKCGAATMTTCRSCETPIRGEYRASNLVSYRSKPAPAFCHECGKPHPWTEARLNAARDLTDEMDALDDDERQQLKQTLDDLVRDTPQTTVAATRFKRLVAKGGQGMANAFRDILVDVASETAKKAIWG